MLDSQLPMRLSTLLKLRRIFSDAHLWLYLLGKERASAITTSLIAIAYLSLPPSQEVFSGLSSAVKNDSAANRMETRNEIEFKSTAGT